MSTFRIKIEQKLDKETMNIKIQSCLKMLEKTKNVN